MTSPAHLATAVATTGVPPKEKTLVTIAPLTSSVSVGTVSSH